jgi:flagellar biosynthetic protein FliS
MHAHTPPSQAGSTIDKQLTQACGGEPGQIPEHMVVLLLEGAQRLLVKVAESMGRADDGARDYYLKRVDAILKELDRRLNHEGGGELAENLGFLYMWWTCKLVVAGARNDSAELTRISSQMGEIRNAWEFILFKGEGMSENPDR